MNIKRNIHNSKKQHCCPIFVNEKAHCISGTDNYPLRRQYPQTQDKEQTNSTVPTSKRGNGQESGLVMFYTSVQDLEVWSGLHTKTHGNVELEQDGSATLLTFFFTNCFALTYISLLDSS